jgi:hypothetical protein
MGDVDDESLGLKQAERLPNRDDADAQAFGKCSDIQPFAGLELASQNRIAQRLIDELLFRYVATLDRCRHLVKFVP